MIRMARFSPLLLFLAIVPTAAQSRPSSPAAVISGVIVDSVSGAPLVGAKVAAMYGRPGRILTDSAGRFRLDRITTREVDFELHCPSRTSLGKRLLARRMAIPVGAVITLKLSVDGTLCDEPPLHSVVGIFRGHYRAGFEESSFVMCADSTKGTRPALGTSGGFSDLDVWVRFSREAQRRPFPWPKDRSESNSSGDAVYVSWLGTLTGPGTYGHMGVAAYEFVVDSVLYVAPEWSGSNCVYPPERQRQ